MPRTPNATQNCKKGKLGLEKGEAKLKIYNNSEKIIINSKFSPKIPNITECQYCSAADYRWQ
jgi:hypothetical protein